MNFTNRQKARDLVKSRKASGKFAKLVDNGVDFAGSRWTVKIVG